MLKLKRLVQITLFALALVSSALLGLGLESSRLIVIAFIGATIGFFVTDIFKLFRIDGMLANIASIVILYLAMKGFFSEDSTGKLVSVANLLVYLQTVLMFQDKTPRLNWQILVLSLLQVVVGTIFTLDLEAGMLFMVYFLVAGMAMVLQSVYTDSLDLEKRDRKTANRISRVNLAGNRQSDSEAPLLFVDQRMPQKSKVLPMLWHLGVWLAVATTFTAVLFYLVPRHAKPWYGPTNIEVSSTGVSKSVDLDERGIISLSNQLMFRVKFTNIATGRPIEIAGNEVYFRGLALSSLVIQNNKTNWIAPHDRVSKRLYQRLGTFLVNRDATTVYQTITMEETTDPLLYSVMPYYRTNKTPDEMMFCQEISALTRCQINDLIDMTPYTYEGGTHLKPNGQFFKAWPYLSNSRSAHRHLLSMTDDRPQHHWLTQMDPERYASLVAASDQLARENEAENGDRLSLFKKMESYLLDPSRFSYTLDFRNIERDEQLDPVEDFFRNHRQGHCELYASALTLMLRRQDVPARLVVGFYGAESNQLTGGYMVRAKNAHAWVEAYLRPDDCPQSMTDSGEAGPGGAWMILDPTPHSGLQRASIRDNTMELARTVWDDYVLGMDAESSDDSSPITLPLFRFLQYLDMDRLEAELKRSSRMMRKRSNQYIAIGMVGLIMFVVWWRTTRRPSTKRKVRKIGMLRRLFADAISLIAPSLGAWVEGRPRHHPTAFYQKLERLLAEVDLERLPSQTHREFASQVASHFESHPSAPMIQSTVHEITELFNEVRFGQADLEPELNVQIEMSLDELKLALTPA